MRRTRTRLAVSAVLCVLCSGPAACSRDAAVPEGYFGMHAHHKPGYEGVFSGAPFAVLRLWDTGTDWGSLEPEEGRWNFTNLDDYARRARASGKTVLLTLGLTPFWASSDPSQLSPYGDSSCAPPENLEDWRMYVRTLAERNENRYGGVIRYWEIWNEPDNFFPGFSFYRGTIEQLVALAESAHEVLKEVNPENLVISPGVTQAGAWWLDRYLRLGGAPVTDIVGFHFYWDWFSDTLASFQPAIRSVQAVAEQNGCGDRPLWLTETGFNAGHYGTAERQLRGMVELVVAPWYHGADASFVYAWNNDLFTRMYDNEEQQETRNAPAYRALVRWVSGARMTRLGLGREGTRVCKLDRDGKRATIVWRFRGDPAPYEVPEAWGDRMCFLDGSEGRLPPDRRTDLGIVPVLICQEGY